MHLLYSAIWDHISVTLPLLGDKLNIACNLFVCEFKGQLDLVKNETDRLSTGLTGVGIEVDRNNTYWEVFDSFLNNHENKLYQLYDESTIERITALPSIFNDDKLHDEWIEKLLNSELKGADSASLILSLATGLKFYMRLTQRIRTLTQNDYVQILLVDKFMAEAREQLASASATSQRRMAEACRLSKGQVTGKMKVDQSNVVYTEAFKRVASQNTNISLHKFAKEVAFDIDGDPVTIKSYLKKKHGIESKNFDKTLRFFKKL